MSVHIIAVTYLITIWQLQVGSLVVLMGERRGMLGDSPTRGLYEE